MNLRHAMKRKTPALRNLLYFVVSYFCGMFLSYVQVQMFGGSKGCRQSDNAVRSFGGFSGRRHTTLVPPASNIYIGMMSAEKFVDNRVQRAIDTWMQKGGWKVEVFAHANSSVLSVPPGLDFSIVTLPSVDDTAYPPQKKCFMMIRHMFDNHIDDYDWFLRVDDDVYIDFSHLSSLLNKLNSSAPVFLGSPGFGIDEDDGMERGMFYLMGGPGMIFSRGLLKILRSRLSYCIQHMFSPHEDVEVGRCVWKHIKSATIPIAWEVLDFFYQQYDKKTGDVVNVIMSEVGHHRFKKTITFHAVKTESLIYQLHQRALKYKIHDLLNKTTRYSHEVKSMMALLNAKNIINLIPKSLPDLPLLLGSDHETMQSDDDATFENHDKLWLNNVPWLPSMPKLISLYSHDAWIEWDKYYRHQPDSIIPMRGHSEHEQAALLRYLFEIESYNHQKSCPGFGKESQFVHGYLKVASGEGLILATTHRTYAGGKLRYCFTLAQASFGLIFLSENGLGGLSRKLKSFLKTSDLPDSLICKESDFDKSLSSKDFKTGTEVAESAMCHKPVSADRVVFVIPLLGRYQALEQFMSRYESEFLRNRESKSSRVLLVVILFGNNDNDDELGLNRAALHLLKSYQKLYGPDLLQYHVANGDNHKFSRGAGMQLGSLVAESDDILFFMDIDMIVTEQLVSQCRNNVELNRTVWYPIPFSQYDPDRLCMDDTSRNDLTLFKMVPKVRDSNRGGNDGKNIIKQTPLLLKENRGFWRDFGFGIACMYKLDFLKAGGFDLTIEGWGEEDIRMYLSLLRYGLDVKRWKQEDLVHIFHTKVCHSTLVGEQALSCRRTKASHYASLKCLAQHFFERPL
ncbi:chondroitin sulfate synthase 1-like [Clavelina lepadiformis]|uniref:chondroitin sulfate synthase 1-like n=1 Tax=Clavelina lepadiformis TaxID=159417 RepID=UPI0040422CEA